MLLGVWGLAARVLRVRDFGVGLGVWNLGFRVRVYGFQVQGFGAFGFHSARLKV